MSPFAQILDSAAELSIIGSFTRWGYERRAPYFDPADLDQDLAGKTYIVTGANSGIGFETAKALAQRNAQVVLVCRNLQKAEAAIQLIHQDLPSTAPRAKALRADLSDLQQTQQVVLEIQKKFSSLQGLILNAGNGLEHRELNPQGIESMFATNVLSPFILTQGLLPLLRQSNSEQSPGRVLWVSSGGMYTSGLDVEDLQWSRRPYIWLKVYAENKKAMVLLAEEFASQEPKPRRVVFQSMHPGWVATNLVHDKLPGFAERMKNSLRTPSQGADTLVWLSMAKEAIQSSGEFWLDRKPRRKVLLPSKRVSKSDRKKLFETCQGLSGSIV